MKTLFISHVEEDAQVALTLADLLEQAGFTTWCYERDSLPGISYLLQTGQAIDQCKAVLLIISVHALSSHQVTKEVVRAHESNKPIMPLLVGVSHAQFQKRQPEWREAIGAAASLPISQEEVGGCIPKVTEGLKSLGIMPTPKPADTNSTLSEIQEVNRLESPHGKRISDTGRPTLEEVTSQSHLSVYDRVSHYLELLDAETAQDVRRGAHGLIQCLADGDTDRIFAGLKTRLATLITPVAPEKLLLRSEYRRFEEGAILPFLSIIEHCTEDQQRELYRALIHNHSLRYGRVAAVERGGTAKDWASLLTDPDDELREAIVLRLAKQEGPFVETLLLRALRDDSFLVVSAAASAISERKSEGALDDLIYVLKGHPHAFARRAVVRPIGEFGGAQARAALDEALESEKDKDVKKAITTELYRLNG